MDTTTVTRLARKTTFEPMRPRGGVRKFRLNDRGLGSRKGQRQNGGTASSSRCEEIQATDGLTMEAG